MKIHIYHKLAVASLFLFILFGCNQSKPDYTTDPGPCKGIEVSKHFSISISNTLSFTYQNFKRNTEEKYLNRIDMESVSWTSLVSSKSIEATVTFKQKENLKDVVIHPLSLGIVGTIKNNTVTFSMPASRHKNYY